MRNDQSPIFWDRVRLGFAPWMRDLVPSYGRPTLLTSFSRPGISNSYTSPVTHTIHQPDTEERCVACGATLEVAIIIHRGASDKLMAFTHPSIDGDGKRPISSGVMSAGGGRFWFSRSLETSGTCDVHLFRDTD